MDLKAWVKWVWEKASGHKKRILLGIVGGLLLVVLVAGISSALFGKSIRMVNLDPSGEIGIKTNLTFSFSSDIVDASEVGKTFTGDLIQFTPAIPGRYRYISRRELRYLPEAPLRPSTHYTAILKPEIVRIRDRYLGGNKKVEFRTEQFKVDNADLNFTFPEGQKGVQLVARINFNYPVDPVALRKAIKLRLTDRKRSVGFTLDTTMPSPNMVVTSEPLMMSKDEQRIELTVPAGFRCIGGGTGLRDQYTMTSAVGAKKELSIVEALPKYDDTNCWIAIRCSEPADEKTIANYVKVKPRVSYKVEVEGEYILIKSDQFKSGDTYTVQVKPGLPSLNGFPLKRDFSASVFFGDLEPSLKFNSPGRYLSSKGFLNLGLETVNIERVNIEISQIFANNIVSYLNNNNSGYYDEEGYGGGDINTVGRVVKSEVIRVNGEKNQLVTLPINLGQYLKNFRGIFQVIVYDEDNRWRQDSKYVIITDLGIVAKMGRNELAVWVNSLETLAPKANTKVSLISRNNQTIATQVTDNQGIARFKGIKKGMKGFESFIILAEEDNDFSFVHLASSLVSVADFDVRGREHLEDGYEAFLYYDRDIFRPGDHGNLVAVVRGPNGVMPPEFPVKLEIRQPDGQVFRELKSSTGDRGSCEFPLEIPDYAQTGRYTANLIVAEQVIGTNTFSVEDFMPERIKVTTITDKSSYICGDTATVKVEGINLFGPPAAGRRAELRLQLEAVPFTAPGFGSYTFGDPGREFKTKEEELGESKLDGKGHSTYTYEFPRGMTPAAKLQAIFQSTVIEDGGRAVSHYKSVDLHPYNCYIGIKPLADYYGEVGRPYPIKYVVLDTQGKPVAKPEVTAEVYRITWNTIYRKNESGRYEYASVEERERVYRTNLTGAGERTFQYSPKDYGEYQVFITDPKSQSRASLTFYASGWGYAPWAMAEPDKIQLDLDQKTYKTGSQAKLQIKAPFSGKALITVERERIYDYQVVELKENTAVVPITIKNEYKPNVFVSVHLIRSIKSLEKKAPVRAFGTIPLTVDCSANKLDIGIDSPKEMRPQREMEVTVKVGRTSGNAYLTLAGVDEGICQLTGYDTPNPTDFFYGKRGLNVDTYDLYGMILPEVEPMKGKSSPGGDAAMNNVRKRNLNPVSVKRVKPVSLWSGLVKLDGNGQARIKFHVPQFNGTLRLMAVVADGNNFGSAQKKVIIRDPVVLTPTFPRFVAPLDEFTVPVSVFNGTGKPGSFEVKLTASGPVQLVNGAAQRINLKNHEELPVYFQMKAKNAMGKLNFTLQVNGNGQLCTWNEELAVRPGVALTQKFYGGSVTAGKPLGMIMKDQWIPGTAKYVLTLAPFPALKFAGGLEYLLGYPHGCVEQTTSKVFPLIYFDNLARASHHPVFKGGNADYFINQGIEKLQSMQLRDGGFAYWPGGNEVSDWGSIYASHFLVEARKAGYTVSDRVYGRMLSYLQNQSKVREVSAYDLETRVYALYVLSLAGHPQLSTMGYLRNSALHKLSDYSQAQLAAAYFYAGERKTARQILPVTFSASGEKRESGGNFDSPIRSAAIILSALADVDPGNPAVYKLVNRLSKASTGNQGYWGTTQENAFALMALGKILAKKSEGTYEGQVFVNGTKIADFDNSRELRLDDRRLGSGKITVKVKGRGACYYFLQGSGIPAQNDTKETDAGIKVRREYLDRNGNRINPGQIRQGDLIVADITVTPSENNLNNVAIVDLLPAGLEVENPRLASSANLAWLSKGTLKPDYMDIRDDRLVIFASFENTETHHFYYALRAVACGQFQLPSLKAECMYEPEVVSFASGGQLTIRNN